MTAPRHSSYDVVIVGGAIMGASVAWHLAARPDFQGRILVVERDPSYRFASTSLSNSSIRQQFSTSINVQISQYGAEFIQGFRDAVGDQKVPDIATHYYGYLYLANTAAFAKQLRRNQALQASLGAATEILTPGQIADRFGFFNLDDIVLGSFGPRDEGYFDGATMFDWLGRAAKRAGVEYLDNEVAGIATASGQVTGVTLISGETVACSNLVNAAGTRAAGVAAMAGLEIPVEPRKRYVFVFDMQNGLDRALPLTIDPCGIHMQSDGGHYLCGGAAPDDPAVALDDFDVDHELWESHFWPVIAARVPAFEAVKVSNSWVGHYAYNRLDQNAIVGPHPELGNFFFVNGFSGHGLQQAPAMGRGVAELIAGGAYQTLDLSELGIERVLTKTPFQEAAII